MADEIKQNIEGYVATALKARTEDGARALSALRDDLLAALSRFETALRTSGESPISLPDALFPEPVLPAASEAGLLSHVIASQRELLAATDQVGLLTQLLLACTVSCPRVAFFIVKKDSCSGWAARGFEGTQDADVRGLTISLDDETILGAAYKAGEGVRARGGTYAHDAHFLSRLGTGAPAEAMAIPVWIREKIAAILYGDSGRDPAITDPELPEVLAVHAGLCLETLATRQKYPRVKPGQTAPHASPAPAAPAPEIVAAPGAGTMAGMPSPKLDSTSGRYAVRPVPPAAPVQAAPPPAPAPAPAAAPPSLEGLSDEDRKVHEEARRFARLLVSEIVLYNERQVEEGRRQKDLYTRLKEDIDRSRAMYDQRVSAKVRTTANYFYQELVRTLANGDESAIKVPWA